MDIGIRADGLSTTDFEKFAIDLTKRKFNNKIHGFPEGKDDGIDGVDDIKNPSIIIQSKRWGISRSGKSAVAELKKEIDKIVIAKDKYNWENKFEYVIVTTVRLSPENLKKIRDYADEFLPGSIVSDENIIFSSMLDTYSREEKYQDIFEKYNLIEKDFSKILQKVRDIDILESVEIESRNYYQELQFEYFVETSFLGKAYEILQREHILLIQGPAGVGKTTTCAMLGNILLNNKENSFDIIVRNVENIDKVIDLYNKIYINNDNKNLFVVFDDFLGRNRFDIEERSFKAIRKLYSVAKNTSNLFICLNSRTQILQDARQRDDEFQRLIDVDFKNGRSFIIDLSKYSDVDKAKILRKSFERKLSTLSNDKKEELASKYASLIGCDWNRIIKHKNYYPRLAEFVVDNFEVSSKDFFSYFIESFDKPLVLYDKLFDNLSDEEKYILFLLLKFNKRLVKVNWLKNSFNRLNLKETFDLEKSLKVLDESWIYFWRNSINGDIEDEVVDFLNPSIIDYLNEKIKIFPGMVTKIMNNAIYLCQLINQENFNDLLLENWDNYLDKSDFIGERLITIVYFDKYSEYATEFNELLNIYDGRRILNFEAGWGSILHQIAYSDDERLRKYILFELQKNDLADRICSSKYINSTELDSIVEYIDILVQDFSECVFGKTFKELACYELFIKKKIELIQEYIDYDIIYDVDYSDINRDNFEDEIDSEITAKIEYMLKGDYDWRNDIECFDFEYGYAKDQIYESIEEIPEKKNMDLNKEKNIEKEETIASILNNPLM